MEFDPATGRLRIPVLIDVEPERMLPPGTPPAVGDELMARLVKEGMRGQLKSGSLLTGQLLVSFDMHRDAPPATIVQGEQYAQLPTIPAPLDEIINSLTRVAAHLEKMPLDQIGAELRETLRHVNRDLMPSLGATLTQAKGTLASVGPDSSVNAELRRALNDVAEAARALQLTADELERQPQSVLFGKGGGD
jgi:paraquat-inducible protein B